ncbi:hypothetical protein Sme01_29660 [Sphaerisporangium melleum]|uniref:Clp R domain-containing protein n=1 Tax=Sphaerisporangium melleum TaxID=321316 RepID=A0A917R1S3_9ACTN|nr:Clp protease N-terminal domain-containing protein [Sphaerisporangium melleum]GGK85053.1 hypothetical protein GCM10007964_29440 [Sphaerisporangium melleum]GII70490.1 hypothetical protein Sme01_29660 [Sphaerisporangium melleum]
MPKINVYLPDELAEAVKEMGVPVSAICQRALEQAVRRIAAIRQTAVGELDTGELAERLPHFTPRCRAVVKMAIDRARERGEAGVGTGHLLAGMVDEGSNLALHVLRAMEIDPAHVSRELERLAIREEGAAGEGGPDGGGGPARRSAAEAGGTGDDAGPAGLAGAGTAGAMRFSGPAAAALELAVTEATALGHNYVGCEHLLLGFVAEPDGAAGQVLRALGAEPRLTRRAVNAALAGYVHLRAQTSAQTPVQGAAGAPADPMQALAAAVSRQLQPLIARIERLERRAGAGSAAEPGSGSRSGE